MYKIKISEEWVDTLEKYKNKILQDGYGIFGYNDFKISRVVSCKRFFWGYTKTKVTYYLEDINFICNYQGKIGTFKERYIENIFLWQKPSFISKARESFEKTTETLSLFGYEIVKKEKKR